MMGHAICQLMSDASLKVASITARKSDNAMGSVFLDRTRTRTSHSSWWMKAGQFCKSKVIPCP